MIDMSRHPEFNHHFSYEVWMFDETFKRLEEGFIDPFTFNVFHESYFIHAGNILDILEGAGHIHPANIKEIRQMITDQITTMGEGRVAEMALKLLPHHRKEVHDYIMDRVKRD